MIATSTVFYYYNFIMYFEKPETVRVISIEVMETYNIVKSQLFINSGDKWRKWGSTNISYAQFIS